MCDNCVRLQRQVRELKEEIAEYERAGPPPDKAEEYRLRYKLTPVCSRILARLVAASPNIVTNDQIHFEASADKDTSLNVIKVHMCILRKALPVGSINTVWGVGYHIPTDKLEAVK